MRVDGGLRWDGEIAADGTDTGEAECRGLMTDDVQEGGRRASGMTSGFLAGCMVALPLRGTQRKPQATSMKLKSTQVILIL